MSKAIDVMVQHVENLKRMYEREHSELEETRWERPSGVFFFVCDQENVFGFSQGQHLYMDCDFGRKIGSKRQIDRQLIPFLYSWYCVHFCQSGI